MDPLTHALASYSLQRAALPRAGRPVIFAMVIAGTVADLDYFSTYFGPSTYLAFHRTYLHSLLGALLFALLLALPFLVRRSDPAKSRASLAGVFFACFSAAALHLLLDLCQSAGVELFWPFSGRRFGLDWVASYDLWILAILLAGILIPMLAGLVTEEIGAKSKGPRGRVGASLSLSILILYIVVRSVLHGDAIAAMQSRTYHGELPHKVAAFPEASSPFRWCGIVETESALHKVEVTVGPGASFDPDAAITFYKPEPSPAFQAARDSAVARRFLEAARFPKATVEKTQGGFHVILRDLAYARAAGSGRRVEALIDTDPSGRLLSEELGWARPAK